MNILRPQDIYVLLALVANHERKEWTYDRLADEVGLSTSQVFRSLKRAESSHLFDKQMRRVRTLELLEFLGHGIRYAFAATPGRIQRGFPTCWEAPGLEEKMSATGDERFVWAAPNGTVRGQVIEPLHMASLAVIGENKSLYQLLGLTDILRVGSARERKVAAKVLAEMLR